MKRIFAAGGAKSILVIAVIAVASSSCQGRESKAVRRGINLASSDPQWRSIRAEVFNVRDFGAIGNGVASDAAFIQAAIRAAEKVGGGKVHLPRGTYLFKSTDFVTIHGSNITLAGDGDASIIFIPKWGTGTKKFTDSVNGKSVAIQAHIQLGNPSATIENIRLQDFQILGTRGVSAPLLDDFWNAAQIGTQSERCVVNNSGFSGMHVEKVGGAAFAFNGGQNSGVQSTNNYVLDNVVIDIAYEAVNPWSGGIANTIVCNNRISDTGRMAIEWSSMRAVICNNTITGARGGAIAVEQAASQTGWTIISNNTIFSSGAGPGVPAPAAIQLGEAAGAFRVKVSGNVIRDSHGPGIISQGGGTSDIVIENNTVDGYGLGGSARNPSSAFAIFVANVRGMSQVVGNSVRCTAGPCRGISAGGGHSENSWVDRNVVSGVTNAGGVAFVLPTSAGSRGAGRAGSGGHIQRGFNSYVGRNIDLDTGEDAPALNYANQEDLPNLLPNPTSARGVYSVGGYQSWLVNATQAAEITDLTNASTGKTVTLMVNSPFPVTIRNAGQFHMTGDFVSGVNVFQTISFLHRDGRWVEVSRSMNTR